MSSDPFSLTYSALWDLVENHQGLSELVREGNRIKWDRAAEFDPRKPATTYGSTPELMLVPDFFDTQVEMDNTGTGISRRFNWVIVTGQKMLNTALFPVEYQLLLCMKGGRSSIVSEVPELFNMEIVRGSATIPERTRTDVSWTSVWTIKLDFQI